MEDGELELGPERCLRLRRRVRETHSHSGSHKQAQGRDGLVKTQGSDWSRQGGESMSEPDLYSHIHPSIYPSVPTPSLPSAIYS